MKKDLLYIFNKDNRFERVLTNPTPEQKHENKNTLLNPKVGHLNRIPMEFWLRNGAGVVCDPAYRKGMSTPQLIKRPPQKRSEVHYDPKKEIKLLSVRLNRSLRDSQEFREKMNARFYIVLTVFILQLISVVLSYLYYMDYLKGFSFM